MEKAVEVFKFNAQQHPDEIPHLRRACARFSALGDKANAIKNWDIPARNVPEAHKAYLAVYQKTLQDLKK